MTENKPENSQAIQPFDQVERYVNLTYRAGVILIIVLSGIYALSPIDTVPDLVPIAGQLDDLAVLLSGGGTIGFITLMRPVVMGIMKRPAMRAGCLFIAVVVLILLIGTSIAFFYGVSRVLSLIF
jgi:Protein of unknown function (DUF1232)